MAAGETRENKFQKLLNEIARQLDNDEVESMSWLCGEDFVYPTRDPEQNASALLMTLKEKSKISVADCNYLKRLLKTIQRDKLAETISEPSIEEICDFRVLLYEISLKLTDQQVENLRSLSSLPSSDQEKSPLSLFSQLMGKFGNDKGAVAKLLIKNLKDINKKNLAERIEYFLSSQDDLNKLDVQEPLPPELAQDEQRLNTVETQNEFSAGTMSSEEKKLCRAILKSLQKKDLLDLVTAMKIKGFGRGGTFSDAEDAVLNATKSFEEFFNHRKLNKDFLKEFIKSQGWDRFRGDKKSLIYYISDRWKAAEAGKGGPSPGRKGGVKRKSDSGTPSSSKKSVTPKSGTSSDADKSHKTDDSERGPYPLESEEKEHTATTSGLGSIVKGKTPTSSKHLGYPAVRIKNSFETSVKTHDILYLPGGLILLLSNSEELQQRNKQNLHLFDMKGNLLKKYGTDGPCCLAALGEERVACLGGHRTLDILHVSSSCIKKEDECRIRQAHHSYNCITALDSKTLAAFHDKTLHIISISEKTHRSFGTSERVDRACVSKDGSLMCAYRGSILKIDPTNGAELHKSPINRRLRDVATTGDNLIIVLTMSGIHLYDAQCRRIKTLWSPCDEPLWLSKMSVYDDVIVCCTDRTVYILKLTY